MRSWRRSERRISDCRRSGRASQPATFGRRGEAAELDLVLLGPGLLVRDSPSLTARWRRSQEASCISRVVSRIDSRGVGQRAGAGQAARFRAAVTVEIVRGLLDQRHPFLEQGAEQVRSGEPSGEQDGWLFHARLHTSPRPFAVDTITAAVPFRDNTTGYSARNLCRFAVVSRRAWDARQKESRLGRSGSLKVEQGGVKQSGQEPLESR